MPVFVQIKDPQAEVEKNDKQAFGFGLNTVHLKGDNTSDDIDYSNEDVANFIKTAGDEASDETIEDDKKYDDPLYHVKETIEANTKINRT